MTEPDWFADPAKHEAWRQRGTCPKCFSGRMELLNGVAPIDRWVWRCPMCKTRWVAA